MLRVEPWTALFMFAYSDVYSLLWYYLSPVVSKEKICEVVYEVENGHDRPIFSEKP